LLSEFQNVILCGDLNAKTTALGCRNTNKNGEILEDLLINPNLITLNSNKPTFYRMHDNSSDILDWFLISNNFYNKFDSFEILENNLVDSDHLPILVSLNLSHEINKLSKSTRLEYDFNKTDWEKFEHHLNSQIINTTNESIDSINEKLTKSINEAIKLSTPHKKPLNKNGRLKLPDYLLHLIKHKKELKNAIRKQGTNSVELKKQYNVIKRVVSGEIEALENNNWNDFIKKLGKHPISASAYWRKIKGKPNNSIKTLKFNNKIFSTDQEKATLFSSLLGETFSHNNQNFNSDDPFNQSILQQESNIKNLKDNEPI
jgi:hypothetical protein